MAVWPASLPQYMLRNGFSYIAPKLVIASQNDTGPPSTRRRATVGYGIMGGAFAMNEEQRIAFETFWRDEIASGAVPFSMPHPFRDLMFNALFDPNGEVGYEAFDAVGFWRISMTLFELP